MDSAKGTVASVNVSDVKTVEYRGRSITTGIFKKPVHGRIVVEGINVRGDDQADRSVHGGADRAAYSYALEDYAWWENELGRSLAPGTFGENLSLQGVDVGGALIGERWRAGTATFVVTGPRVPCYKLAMVMDDDGFIRRFAQALRPGAYLAIAEAGSVEQGDPVEIQSKPRHELTVAEMARIFLFERARLRELLVPDLTEEWRAWVLEHLH